MDKKYYLFSFLFWFIPLLSFAQTNDLVLSDKLLPITEQNFFKSHDYYIWDPSIIRDGNGIYHLFYSRWQKKYSFNGWMPLSEIVHATSKSPTGPWIYKGIVLRGRGKGYWDAIGAYNPKIKYFNGKYYLYYVSTNLGDGDYTEKYLVAISLKGSQHKDWLVLRNNQRTGVAVATSLAGPWKRSDAPIIQPSGPITRLTVNPAIAEGPDKKFYLVIKGDKPNDRGYIRNQAIAVSTTPIGPFIMQPTPVIDYIDTEDMSIWYDKNRKLFFGIFHAPKGFLGLIESTDGLHWRKSKDYFMNYKQFLMVNGDIFKPEKMERPFILAENGTPIVLSVAVKQGDDSWLVFVPLKY
ncbi:glycoside hydrolase family protein [Parafilimonas sp.]|uniref:glycoside hydrolase family protein n=1 Tax=Parafilimonas sp. TaxID=1969739 RepID=UPI0039E36CBE